MKAIHYILILVHFVKRLKNTFRCVCGTPVPMLQALKKIGETDMISEKAKAAMEKGDLEAAQELYCGYLSTLDKYLVRVKKLNRA